MRAALLLVALFVSDADRQQGARRPPSREPTETSTLERLGGNVAVSRQSARLSGNADAVAQAIRAIEKLGGTVRHDESRPGRPVVAVELPGCSVSADFLKIAQRFRHLEWLDL